MGSSDRGKGSGAGAKDGFSFDRVIDAAKSKGNNGKFSDSLLGRGLSAIGGALSDDPSYDGKRGFRDSYNGSVGGGGAGLGRSGRGK